jgi:hypothetical protein
MVRASRKVKSKGWGSRTGCGLRNIRHTICKQDSNVRLGEPDSLHCTAQVRFRRESGHGQFTIKHRISSQAQNFKEKLGGDRFEQLLATVRIFLGQPCSRGSTDNFAH